jgi:cyclopropane fatty-acyl-phospholipid synthase-like methyltransferase
MRRLLELEPGMELLDLACGYGRITNRFAKRGCRVTGLAAVASGEGRAPFWCGASG